MAAQAAVVQTCDICDTEESINWFCTKCQEILCDGCKANHQRGKRTRNDKIVPLKEAKDIEKTPVLFCELHSSEEVTFFCEQCQKLICVKCLANDHRDHSWTSFEDYYKSCRQRLEVVKDSLLVVFSKNQDKFDEYGKNHASQEIHMKDIESKIRRQKAKLLQEVSSICDEYLQKVSAVHGAENEKYEQTCKLIKTHSSTINTAITDIQKGSKSGSPSEMLRLEQEACSIRDDADTFVIPSVVQIQYQPGGIDRKIILQLVGHILLNKQGTDAEKKSVMQAELQTQPDSKQSLQKPPSFITSPTGNSDRGKDTDCNKKVTKMRKLRTLDLSKQLDKTVKIIIPLQNDMIWIGTDERYLILVDNTGTIVSKSVDLPSCIADAKPLDDKLLVIYSGGKEIVQLSLDGKNKSTFAGPLILHTTGLCVTRNKEIFACIATHQRSEIIKLTSSGTIITSMPYPIPFVNIILGPYPCAITSIPSGEIYVTQNNVYGSQVLALDAQCKQPLFTWGGQIGGESLECFRSYGITHDKNNNLFITDHANHRLIMMSRDGKKAEVVLNKSNGISYPWGVTVDSNGQLWVGSHPGKISNFQLEY